METTARRLLLPHQAAHKPYCSESRLRRLLQKHPDLAVQVGAYRAVDPADLPRIAAALGVPAPPA
jgi:hypothetical protein